MADPPSGPTDHSSAKLCPTCGKTFAANERFCPEDGAVLRAVEPGASLVGRVLAGRYLVQRELGHGGMGRVYLAEHVRMKRLCALKIIREDALQNTDAVLRFTREATNASKLAHTNVAAIYELGETEDGVLYLAMEFVEGESLAQLLARERPLPPRRAAAIAWQIGEALGAAHERGIIHRDLKPENVMLGKLKDGSDLVKVVDFGLARMMDAESQVVTRTGYVIGSPRYMSPEQLTDSPLDQRTDIYSLALLTYVMLVGRQPWDVGSTAEQPTARLLSPPSPLRQQRPDVAWPEALQRAFDRALAIDPRDRYASANEFVGDVLASVLEWIPDDPVDMAPWNVALRYDPTRRGIRPVTPTMGMGSLAAGTPTGGSPVTESPGAPVTATHVTPPAPAPPPAPAGVGLASARPLAGRRRGPLVAVGAIGGVAVLGFAAWAIIGGGSAGHAGTSPPASPNVAQESVRTSPPPAPPGRAAGAIADSSTTPRTVTQAPKQPAPSGGGRSSRDAGGSGSVASPPATSRGVTPADLLSESQVFAAFTSLKRIAVNPDSARVAITVATQMLPHLATRPDSVEAQYRMVEAHLTLNEPSDACRLLRALATTARGTSFEAGVRNYLASPDLGCP